MDIKKIEELIAKKECQHIEFKTTTGQLKGAFETICAFLNGQGGTLLVGVNDKGEIIGQNVSDATRQEIAKDLNRIEPPADIEIDYIPIDNNKFVIAFQVDTGKHAPYIYDGRPFQRNQSSTIRMQQHRYEQLLVKRGQLNYSWEEIPTSFTIDDLDPTEIQRAINQGISSGRIPADVKHNTNEEILTSWKLIENGMLTNGALVLFAKEILPRYRQCHLKMGRFIGTGIIGDLLDNREFYGNAFQMLTEANHFIMRHLPIASFFEPNRFERIDKPALPVLAVREALVNAICHRDFSNRSSYISVMIFDDRLEIWNNGTLPPELKVDDLKKKHKSVPRNKNISKVFYDRKFFEGWGGGTVTIYNLCREAELPEPVFEEYSGGFSVTFYFKEAICYRNESQVKKPKYTSRQSEILSILSGGKRLPLRILVSMLNNPPAARTVGDDLAFLKHEGLVSTEGIGRGAKWFISKKD